MNEIINRFPDVLNKRTLRQGMVAATTLVSAACADVLNPVEHNMPDSKAGQLVASARVFDFQPKEYTVIYTNALLRGDNGLPIIEPEPIPTPQKLKQGRVIGYLAPKVSRANTRPDQHHNPTALTAEMLARLRECESGDDWNADTGNGFYGAYQFAWVSWEYVGGVGNPAHASPAEQTMRAQMLYNQGGRDHWPVCGPASGLP